MSLENVTSLPDEIEPGANGHNSSHEIIHGALKDINDKLSVFVAVPVYATVDRPAGTVGAHIFDSTLNLPLWFDGTNWIDSAGSVV